MTSPISFAHLKTKFPQLYEAFQDLDARLEEKAGVASTADVFAVDEVRSADPRSLRVIQSVLNASTEGVLASLAPVHKGMDGMLAGFVRDTNDDLVRCNMLSEFVRQNLQALSPEEVVFLVEELPRDIPQWGGNTGGMLIAAYARNRRDLDVRASAYLAQHAGAGEGLKLLSQTAKKKGLTIEDLGLLARATEKWTNDPKYGKAAMATRSGIERIISAKARG